jgi:hypothetical protein
VDGVPIAIAADETGEESDAAEDDTEMPAPSV